MKDNQKQFRFVEDAVFTRGVIDIPVKQVEKPFTRIEQSIFKEAGPYAFEMITSFVNVNDPSTQVFSTTSIFNINKIDRSATRAVVNLRRINDVRRINKFFETINENIAKDAVFIGCAETLELRHSRLLNKFPGIINRFYVLGDYIFKRVFPKLPLTKKLYFALTGGRNRIISRAETLGRLYSCGFEVLHEETHGYLFYFIARKFKTPAYDDSPSYGPVFGMKRTGKDGKLIKVYKLRTMYPFSEYLQQYVYEKNHLDKGGKFKDDFRVTCFGRFARKFWIDELPMLYNWLKGDLKLVGVRPLSKQFQSLYPESLLEIRHNYRPGLVPPYYADMPKNFDEIIESEKRYLESYSRCGWCTDVKYLFRAFFNIVFKKARSK
ncbi:MAG: sugar transferase [Bacteroidales bacterium]|nr:sugar transferase [Bacteroidales bacterium]